MKSNLIAAVAMTAALTLPAQANNIVDEWASTKAPAAPTLKPVTVDPKTTALLMLDFMNQNCGQAAPLPCHDPGDEEAARCRARGQGDRGVLPDCQQHGGRCDQGCGAGGRRAASVLSGPDKFRNTDLEKILKDKGITTVIAVGTSSNGAVLYTASGAAFRGMNVIIPVDGMSAVDPYAEYSTVFTFMNAPSVSAKTTLTRSDMIKF